MSDRADPRTRVVMGDPKYQAPDATLTVRYGGEVITIGKGTPDEKKTLGREHPYDAGAHAAFWWTAMHGTTPTFNEWEAICDTYGIAVEDDDDPGWQDRMERFSAGFRETREMSADD